MHTEEKFEDIIERELLEISGYDQGNPANYDPETALFPSEIINFIQTTQPQKWQRLATTNPSDAQKVIIDSLAKELKSRGMLDVLRNGFKCYGKTLRVAYFQPNTGMNPETLALYQKIASPLPAKSPLKLDAFPILSSASTVYPSPPSNSKTLSPDKPTKTLSINTDTTETPQTLYLPLNNAV